MGYELWTSPLTGYRRVGTRVREIRDMFEGSITVRSIYEPLKACRAGDSAEEIHRLLVQRGFDVAGVKDDGTDAIRLFIAAESLRAGGRVSDHAMPIPIHVLISDSTPLREIFGILGKQTYAFVLSGTVLAGIVTRADLNKPPARIYIFALVSLLEMHLVFWIRKTFGENWTRLLAESRLDLANKLFEERRRNHQELDLCECLQICDKADLVLSDEALRVMFVVPSKNAGKRLFKRAQSLRDLLAHGQANLSEDTTWEKISSTIGWLECALARSDTEIEDAAVKAGRHYVEQFWEPDTSCKMQP
ncbi:MAG: hypothetical protein ACREIF_19060 [Chthoniobacterales bacterium]